MVTPLKWLAENFQELDVVHLVNMSASSWMYVSIRLDPPLSALVPMVRGGDTPGVANEFVSLILSIEKTSWG